MVLGLAHAVDSMLVSVDHFLASLVGASVVFALTSILRGSLGGSRHL